MEKNKIIIPLILIIILILSIIIYNIFLKTPEKNLYNILRKIDSDSKIDSMDYKEDTIRVGKHNVKLKIPKNAKLEREFTEGEKVYSINSSMILVSFFNSIDGNLEGRKNQTAKSINQCSYDEFVNDNSFIEVKVGNNTLYKTLMMTSDGQLLLSALLPGNYGLIFQISNGRNITKNQLQSFLNFEFE